MLDLAGAENAAGAMRGYHPMNAEAILLAAPDVLIVPETTVEGLGGLEGLLALPGVATTPAGKNRRIVMVDLLAFLGFGPRVGEALVELVRALHPEIAGTER
jgi:iron complex transport system substrate-binding protein